jgi:two-component system, cell cycle response regulator DivK
MVGKHFADLEDFNRLCFKEIIPMSENRPPPVVLIVEDNEMNRDMLSRRLQRKGYGILIAVDGGQGVEMAHANKPDLILMDMSLPVKDGWTATKELKQHPDTKHIPVIALTAHAMAGDRENALSAGCDDYDTKPIELPRLIEKITLLTWALPN